MAAGLDAVHVPYKGSAEALTDVMAARVDYYFSPIGLALQHIKAGKLSALGVVSFTPLRCAARHPDHGRSGLPNSDYDVWVGMWAPAKTPPAIVARLNETMARAIRSPEAAETFRRLVAEPMIMTPAQFADLLRKEVSTNGALVKAAGITAN